MRRHGEEGDKLEILTQNEVARRLRLCARQVRNLTDAGMPRVKEKAIGGRFGGYPWPAVRLWYLEFRRRSAAVRALRYEERKARARSARKARVMTFTSAELSLAAQHSTE